jgi:hypothetical protein
MYALTTSTTLSALPAIAHKSSAAKQIAVTLAVTATTMRFENWTYADHIVTIDECWNNGQKSYMQNLRFSLENLVVDIGFYSKRKDIEDYRDK